METDGAAVIYRSSNENSLEASRLIDGEAREVSPDKSVSCAISTVSFRDYADPAYMEFTFSRRKGIIGWKQNIEGTRWDWELVDSRVW